MVLDTIPSELCILPIRKRVLFPGSFLRLSIGRESSVALIKHSVWDHFQHSSSSVNNTSTSCIIGIFTLKDSHGTVDDQDEAQDHGRYVIGTAAKVIQLISSSEDDQLHYSMVVKGLARIQIIREIQRQPYVIASICVLKSKVNNLDQVKLKSKHLRQLAKRYLFFLRQHKQQENQGSVVFTFMKSRELLNAITYCPIGNLADLLISQLETVSMEKKQQALECIELEERLDRATEIIQNEFDGLSLAHNVQQQVAQQMANARKAYLLKQQLKTIQDELRELEQRDDSKEDEEIDEMKQLERSIQSLGDFHHEGETKRVIHQELKRLKTLQPMQPEYHMLKAYLDCVVDLPWHDVSQDIYSVKKVIEQLNLDHYGLDHVKRRMTEYVAVQSLKRRRSQQAAAQSSSENNNNNRVSQETKGLILCLVGPPGCGKTSLGASIARATNRKFQRLSLGGVSDESDIRGHRRTYVGSAPGRIIQSLHRARVRNPVILLDEVDKLGRSGSHHHGSNPASALLEVLDPTQNAVFIDHYLNVPFDLSQVMFIATANSVAEIPPALLDRMEIINVDGYALEDKLAIAAKYLLPKQRRENGLRPDQIHIPERTLTQMILGYTRESGVRQLERELARVCRHVAVQVEVLDQNESQDLVCKASEVCETTFEISPEVLVDISGPRTHVCDHVAVLDRDDRTIVGTATGLAWTSTGGELLFVEVSDVVGSGTVRLTGQLGSVMQESVAVALSWIRSHVEALNDLLCGGGDSTTPLSDMVSSEEVPHETTHNNNLLLDRECLTQRDVHVHFPSGAIPKDGPSAGVAITVALVSRLMNRSVSPKVAMTGEITLRGLILAVGGVKEKVLAAHRAGIRRVILPRNNTHDTESLPLSVQQEMEFIYVEHLFQVLPVVLLSQSKAAAVASTQSSSLVVTNVGGGATTHQQAKDDRAGPILFTSSL